MACAGKRVAPQVLPKVLPIIGEKGLMKLQYIGNDPENLPGQVTGIRYPFDERNPLYVDRRDAAYLLGPEFAELP